MATEKDKVYSSRQAAKAIGIHPTTIRIYVAEGGPFAGIGQLVGHSRVFRESDLALMKKKLAEQPEPGRKPRTKPGSRVSRLTAQQRYALALTLRKEGKSLDEIREKIGYSSITSVSRAIKKATEAQAAVANTPAEV